MAGTARPVILPDSSAWIEYLRRTGSPLNVALRESLRRDADIAVSEPIVVEILAGARSRADLRSTRSLLLAFPMLQVGGLDTWERAAAVQRACRAGGESVRSMMDCLIAAVAIREGASLLHGDRDFDVIARHTGLRIEPLA
jgi:predicted nucleic acid-binding protein